MVEKKYVMAIDQGTTGTRVMLFTREGLPVKGGWAYHEHQQIYPKPGWVEHDPIEIWEKLRCVYAKFLTKLASIHGRSKRSA